MRVLSNCVFGVIAVLFLLALNCLAANVAPVVEDMRGTAIPCRPRYLMLMVGDGEKQGSALACDIGTLPSHGAVTYSFPANYPTNSRSVVYTATNVSYYGTDSFTFRCSDGASTSGWATCTITIVSNTPPVASRMVVTAATGSPTNINLAVSQANSENYNLTCEIVTGPSQGTLVFSYPATYPTNSMNLTYTATNSVSSDSFTFRVSDGSLVSGIATCRITVVSNTPPTSSSVSARTSTNWPREISLAAYDTHTSSSYLRCTITNPPANGVVTWKYPSTYPTNSINVVYTPNPGFTGTDTFAYMASDGLLDSAVATCRVTVAANNAPMAYNGAWSISSGSPMNLYLPCWDTDGDQPLWYEVVTPPPNGTLSYKYPDMYPTNSFQMIYVSDPAFSGREEFTFRVHDGQTYSSLATGTITVGVNTAPTVSVVTAATLAGSPVNVYLNASDTHIAPDFLLYRIAGQPTHGSVDYTYASSYPQSTMYVTYKPEAGFVGTDTFYFVASDWMLDSGIGTATVTVVSNTAPVATNMVTTTAESMPKNITLGVADSFTSSNYLECVIASNPTNGTVEYQNPASYPLSSYNVKYTPAPGFVGTDTFTYRCSDGEFWSGVATCTVTVMAQAERMLVVYNAYFAGDQDSDGTNDSRQVAEYYAAKRGVPAANLLGLNITRVYYFEEGDYAPFQADVVQPIKAKLTELGATNIDTILICYGTPFYAPSIWGPVCLDNTLMALNYWNPDVNDVNAASNPYMENNPTFQGDRGHFSHDIYKFNGTEMYMVGRIDGASANAAMNLVDQALYGERYITAGEGYYNGNVYVDSRAAYTDAELTASDGVKFGYFESSPDQNIAYTEHYVLGTGLTLKWDQNYSTIGTMGMLFSDGTSSATAPRTLFYAGWYGGSPTPFEWLAGSIGCHLHSMSFWRGPGGNSWDATALALGAACVSGTIEEPYLAGIQRPHILIYYILQGYSYGEASMLATPTVGWMPLNVGDPLYTPMKPKTPVVDTQFPTLAAGFPTVTGSTTSGTRPVNICVHDTPEPDVARIVVEYGLTSGYGSAVSNGPAYVRFSALNMTRLQGNSTYHYRVRLTDPVGNVTVTGDYTFNTGVVPNTAPVAVSRPLVTGRDVSRSFAIQANDAEDNALTYTIVDGPVNGHLEGTAPDLVYVPSGGYLGTDSFSFKANDGALDSNTGTVSILVKTDYELGLVAWWKLNETNGIAAADSSGSGYDGTLNNGPVWSTGRNGGGLVYDGQDDSVRAPLVTSKVNDLTFAFWVKINSASAPRGGLLFNGSGDSGYGLFAGSGGANTFHFLAQSIYWHNTGIGWTVGQWCHLAVTLTPNGGGTIWKLYKDGKPVYTSPVLPNAYEPIVDTIVGAEAPSTNSIASVMDDVRVYDRALSDSEIAVLGAPGRSLPDDWRVEYFGNTNAANSGAADDWDHDGANNLAEYMAGTNPTNVSSRLECSAFGVQSSGDFVLTWTSVTGKLYSIQYATDLSSGLTGVLQSSILANPPVNTVTVNVNGASCYYRIGLE